MRPTVHPAAKCSLCARRQERLIGSQHHLMARRSKRMRRSQLGEGNRPWSCQGKAPVFRGRHTAGPRHVPAPVHDTARRFLAFLLPAATVLTLACLIIAAALQQDLRQGADDPQLQLAEDATARLDAGDPPGAVIGAGHVDIATSLDPFVAVYDAGGKALATSGQLDGAAPAPPPGVLDAARATGRDTVTWQPRAGVRVAIAVIPWRGGTVLAGRSLRRVEEMQSKIEGLIALGWLGSLAAVGLASLVAARIWTRS
jgi:hypothetical protein